MSCSQDISTFVGLCLWVGDTPQTPGKKDKGAIMSKYFVIDFKRINTQEAYKNIVVGHNNRKRNYKNNA